MKFKKENGQDEYLILLPTCFLFTCWYLWTLNLLKHQQFVLIIVHTEVFNESFFFLVTP